MPSPRARRTRPILLVLLLGVAVAGCRAQAKPQTSAEVLLNERMATVLRLAVKQHYGIRSEKLAEFGLPPFRGRVRKAPSQPEEPKTPSPAPSPQSADTDR